MKKGKSITLLSIIGVIMAFLLVITFLRFPFGAKENFTGILGGIDLDYSLAGGTSYTLTLDDDSEDVEDVQAVADTIGYRLRELGYQDYSIKFSKSKTEGVKDYDIIIETRGKIDETGREQREKLTSDIQVAAAYGDIKIFAGNAENPTEQVLEDVKVIKDAAYAGKYTDEENIVRYQVLITFTNEAYDYIKSQLEAGAFYMKVTLGEEEILSGAEPLSLDYFVNNSIAFTTVDETSAQQMALKIKTGGLAYKYNVSKAVSVTSPYGEDVATNSAVVIGALLLVLVVAFVVLYKGYGIISGVSLIAFMLVELLMLIAVPNIRLAIGGVIGMAIALVLCADGMLVLSKRISEEFANGKTIKASIKTGFKRSLAPVLFVCGTAIVISLLAFAFGFGSIRNFGIVLGIGSAIAIVINLLFVRLMVALFLPLLKKPEAFLNLKRDEEVA